MKPLLVGELNPYGSDPAFALYHTPENSAGGRLCRLVMGLRRLDYERSYDRANLCAGKWSAKPARERAAALLSERLRGAAGGPPPVVVLLGARVCSAFGRDYQPFCHYETSEDVLGESGEVSYVVLPHPSGLCRLWNAPGSFGRARESLRSAGCAVGDPLP